MSYIFIKKFNDNNHIYIKYIFVEIIFKHMVEKLININNINKIMYDDPYIESHFNDDISDKIKKQIYKKNFDNRYNKIIFADNTASGRPCKLIDKIIEKNILPYYTNVRSNAYCGIFMKNQIKKTRNYIRKIYNLNKQHKIIFTGSGSTGAINHLINSINFDKYKKINVIITIFEHYSNILPWYELKNKYNNVEIYISPITSDCIIDNNYVETIYKKINDYQYKSINIISVSGCSNVTGIKSNIDDMICIVKTNKNKSIHDNFLFVDYATLSPYQILDIHDIDAIFISPHKFLGGTSTPGILIANDKLFGHEYPQNPGGGCTSKITENGKIFYFEDIEKKEPGGTCNIVGIIRIRLCLKIINVLEKIIDNNEKYITQYIHQKFDEMKQKKNLESKFDIMFHNINKNNRLSIICLFVYKLHYNFVVALLNDIFGIQTRGGISCCGLFENKISKIYKNYKGWCRITFNWYMDKNEIDYILNSIEYVILYGHKFLNKYDYDVDSNIYTIKNK